MSDGLVLGICRSGIGAWVMGSRDSGIESGVSGRGSRYKQCLR